MINEIISIDTGSADKIAEGYFKAICGFDRDDPAKNARTGAMLRQGIAVREQLRDSIRIRAVVSAFDKIVISGRSIRIGPVVFVCNAFEQMETEHITRVYAFIITAGSFEIESASMLDRFYADAWGTAYIDAGRDILRDFICKHEKDASAGREGSFVSDPFGPGFYGMDVEQMGNFFRLLDAEAIGVSLTGSMCMLPLKSCAGFHVAVDNAGRLPPDGCRSCLAGGKGCEYCHSRIKSKDR